MKLAEFTISNYRSFGKKPVIIPFESFSAFIGHNSAGKSTILSALNCMFNNIRLKKDDFHEVSQSTDIGEETSLYFEAKFEFYDKKGEDDYSIPSFFESFTVENEGELPFILIRYEANWKPGNTPEGLIETNLSYVTFRGTQRELKPMSVHDKSKIDVIYIPAIRNPYEQLKNASGTILWRLLNQINWKETDKVAITDKINDLDKAISSQSGIELLEKTISQQWKAYHNNSRFNKANIRFGSTDLEQILKKLEVEFSPAPYQKSYTVKELGDGLQSLFYLSLIDSFLKIEQKGIEDIKKKVEEDKKILNTKPPAITLLLVEEPENHVSPHLLGSVLKNLVSISENLNSQVLFTSHSPSVIKRVEPEQIRHVRLENSIDASVVNKILLPSKSDEAHKFVKEAVKKYPELYFSTLVILGEVDSEEILLPHFLSINYPNLDYEGISVVPLGGRHVNHFWRLLNLLKIPFITLLDLDKERYGGGWGRIKYAIKEKMKIDLEIGEITLTDGSILKDNLESLHLREIKDEQLQPWVTFLEEYDIYFSFPIDIDFLMLENYKDEYISILNEQEGPVLSIGSNNFKISELTPDQKKEQPYFARRNRSISNTLKEKGGDGSSFTLAQKELMIWYDYFFLNRGKPVTHLLALQNIEIQDAIPELFQRIAKKVHQKLGGE
ncbi:ATP-dependent endonuclease [Oceanobacillus sp. CFH 90083]|uniref:ATP-dependent nuclease n=1 Tax=Oceanobacillus sp. CFH 90083 TaxID=2592336 RepID=UPI00128C88C9|nr:AAA family ATPase [Oceanobacillus sp. CFH 90083]